MRDDDRYIAKKSSDKISYLIDALIEHFSSSAADRTLIHGNELPVGDYEKVLRMLAAESRLSRRHLARALVDLLSSANALGRPRSKCVVPDKKSGTGYCLLVIPCPQNRDYDKHRLSRLMLLTAVLQSDENPVPLSTAHCRLRNGTDPWRTAFGRSGISGCNQLDRGKCPRGTQHPAQERNIGGPNGHSCPRTRIPDFPR